MIYSKWKWSHHGLSLLITVRQRVSSVIRTHWSASSRNCLQRLQKATLVLWFNVGESPYAQPTAWISQQWGRVPLPQISEECTRKAPLLFIFLIINALIICSYMCSRSAAWHFEKKTQQMQPIHSWKKLSLMTWKQPPTPSPSRSLFSLTAWHRQGDFLLPELLLTSFLGWFAENHSTRRRERAEREAAEERAGKAERPAELSPHSQAGGHHPALTWDCLATYQEGSVTWNGH